MMAFLAGVIFGIALTGWAIGIAALLSAGRRPTTKTHGRFMIYTDTYGEPEQSRWN
jgi:hypothetical protein